MAEECGLNTAIEAYFKGEAINQTENRAVLHTALRSQENDQIFVDGLDVIPEVFAVKEKIREFTDFFFKELSFEKQNIVNDPEPLKNVG